MATPSSSAAAAGRLRRGGGSRRHAQQQQPQTWVGWLTGWLPRLLIWNQLYTNMSALGAGVVLLVAAYENSGDVVRALEEAVAREPARVWGSLTALAEHAVDTFTLRNWVAMVAYLAVVAVGAAAYRTAARVLRDASVRRAAVRAQRYAHAADFRHTQNAQLNTRYGSVAEALLFTSATFVLDPNNLVTAAIVVLQGLGSRWTKHYMNLAMYAGMAGFTLFTELFTYLRQRDTDRAINAARYWAAPLGSARAAYTPPPVMAGARDAVDASALAARLTGFQHVAAESLGLGNLVVVPPGARVPIDGFVLPPPLPASAPALVGLASVAPFSYTVTGENTVLNPPIATLPIAFTAVASMECVPAGVADVLDDVKAAVVAAAAAAPTPAAAGVVPAPPLPPFAPAAAPAAVVAAAMSSATVPLTPLPAGVTPTTGSAPRSRRRSWTPASASPHSLQSPVMRRASSTDSVPSTRDAAPAADATPDGGDANPLMLGTRARRFVRMMSREGTLTPAVAAAVAAPAGSGLPDSVRRHPVGAFTNAVARARPAAPRRLDFGGGGGSGAVRVAGGAVGGGAGGGGAVGAAAAAVETAAAAAATPAAAVPAAAPAPAAAVPATAPTAAPAPAPAPTSDGGESEDGSDSDSDEVVGDAAAIAAELFVYRINGMRVGAGYDRVPRGAVHAPEPDANGRLHPLFLLAALPRRFEGADSGAREPVASSWEWVLQRVMGVQVVILVAFAVQGVAAAAEMRHTEVTMTAAVAFFLGQLVLGNTLLPLRTEAISALWRRMCNGIFGGITIKNPLALETLRTATNVVADKTGTLTIDGMRYTWPIAAPAGLDGHGWRDLDGSDVGPALLLATNDSVPNPLAGVPAVDARLHDAPTLCTTGEEGVLFAALMAGTPPAPAATPGSHPDRVYQWVTLPPPPPPPPPSTSSSSPPPPSVAVMYDAKHARHVRLLWHYRGGFEPDYVARFAVVSLHTRSVAAAADPTSLPAHDVGGVATTPAHELAAAGWVAAPASLMVVQGGGDKVAQMCGPGAAVWEAAELAANPLRTFGHGVAAVPADTWPLWDVAGHPVTLQRPRWRALHATLADAASYRLAYLSKFDNPVVPGGEAVFDALRQHGVRLHVCTGDTLLTLQAVLVDMRMLPPTGAVSIHWDTNATPDLVAAMAAEVSGQGGGSGPLARAVEAAAGGREHRVVVFADTKVLQFLHDNRRTRAVQGVTTHPAIHFAFFRVKQTLKPLAVRLLSAAEGAGTRCVFIGDGPNDEPALAATEHSLAIGHGSAAARNSANFEVTSSVSLPDAFTMAKLFHGGRAIILRDIVFSGTVIVVLLEFAAHLSNFAPLSGGPAAIAVLPDPWNPLLMSAFTLLLHTPRMFVLALTEGLRESWRDHRDLLAKCVLEVVLAMACAAWVGLSLKGVVEASDRPVDAVQLFAPLALAALAVLTYLRQNLIVSHRLLSPPRAFPPNLTGGAARDYFTHLYSAPDVPDAPLTDLRPLHRRLAMFAWLYNGFLGQGAIVAAYLAFIATPNMRFLECVGHVARAVLLPALAMGIFHAVWSYTRDNAAAAAPPDRPGRHRDGTARPHAD